MFGSILELFESIFSVLFGGRFFRSLFESILSERCAGSAAEAGPAEGGEASPRSYAEDFSIELCQKFSECCLYPARPATSEEVRRIYRLPPLPPTSPALDDSMNRLYDFLKMIWMLYARQEASLGLARNRRLVQGV